MSVKSVMEHWARKGMFEESFIRDGTPCKPGPDVIGFIVAWDRELKQLSMEALASLANVSVSTIERIERCETVSDTALRNVAVALGREEGAFVDVRVPLAPAEALTLLKESGQWIDETVEFSVQPLRTQRQLRAIADSAAILVDGSRLRDGLEDEIDNLRDYFGLASFLRAEQAGLIQGDGEVKMRSFYGNVLNAVQAIERGGPALALAGTYQAKVGQGNPMAGSLVTVGVVAFFPKRTDPCASKRPVLRGQKVIDIGWGE